MTDLHRFADIHTHDRSRATDGSAIVNITPGEPMLPGGTYSVGIHPWDTVQPITPGQLKALVAAARDERVVAIGECGFDTLRGGPVELQRRLFDFHVRLARRVGKPVIIHAVRANQELMDAARRHPDHTEWIIHGFRGKPEFARQLLRAGYSISLGEHHHPDLPSTIPPTCLYHETDAPHNEARPSDK